MQDTENEAKELILETIKKGFVNDSRILGIAYAIRKFRNENPDDIDLPDIIGGFKNAIEKSGLQNIVENQVDYYISLVNYDGILIWEEKEKVSELDEGIQSLLEFGVSCSESMVQAFYLAKEAWDSKEKGV